MYPIHDPFKKLDLFNLLILDSKVRVKISVKIGFAINRPPSFMALPLTRLVQFLAEDN